MNESSDEECNEWLLLDDSSDDELEQPKEIKGVWVCKIFYQKRMLCLSVKTQLEKED